jgi:RepB DNA-primase from phage plasmid
VTTTAPPRAAADARALDQYLRMLAGPAPGARLLEIRFALRHRDMGRVFIAARGAVGASRFIRRVARRTDVYIGVSLRGRAAGGRDAVHVAHLVYVEIDSADADRELASFAHPPTLVIASGTPGHRHAYWQLDEPISADALEDANRRLAMHLGADISSTDRTRVLRLLSVGDRSPWGVSPARSLADASVTEVEAPDE